MFKNFDADFKFKQEELPLAQIEIQINLLATLWTLMNQLSELIHITSDGQESKDKLNGKYLEMRNRLQHEFFIQFVQDYGE